jgi:DNA-binding MarR family transcriptional regulator
VTIKHTSKSAPGKAGAPARRKLVRAMAKFGASYGKWVRVNLREVDGITPPRLGVLQALFAKGPQIMAELADRLEVSARNVTVLIDGMERDGFLERRAHTTDRRATVIALTPAGEALCKQILSVHEDAVGRVFGALDEAAAENLLNEIETMLVWFDSNPEMKG